MWLCCKCKGSRGNPHRRVYVNNKGKEDEGQKLLAQLLCLTERLHWAENTTHTHTHTHTHTATSATTSKGRGLEGSLEFPAVQKAWHFIQHSWALFSLKAKSKTAGACEHTSQGERERERDSVGERERERLLVVCLTRGPNWEVNPCCYWAHSCWEEFTVPFTVRPQWGQRGMSRSLESEIG